MTFEPPVTVTLHHTLLSVTHHDADIDECQDNYTCSYMEGTVCYNTIGSYDCRCPLGYTYCYENNQCTCELCGITILCSYMHTHTTPHSHAHMHTQTQKSTHTQIHTRKYTHKHTHTNTNTHTHKYTLILRDQS